MFSCRQRRYPVISELEHYRHPEDSDSEVENEEFMEFSNAETEDFSCDTCDKYFSFKEEYDVHMSQHKVCNLDGCTFNAHEKIIERHIRLQHSTGLYDRIRNINSPEDINKWIEERRKKYPNKMNIQKRYQEQEEQIKRGERIFKNKRKFAENKHQTIKTRNKKIHVRQNKMKTRKTMPLIKREKSLITENGEWNKMFPFKGTTNLYNQEVKIEEEKYEDDEWNAPASNNVIVLNNALGALMGAYMSGDESDEAISPAKNFSNQIPQESVTKIPNSKEKDDSVVIETNVCDNEPPIEMKIEKIQRSSKFEELNNKSENKERLMRKNVEKKKYKTNTFISSEFSFKKRKVTLLEKLLDTEIRQERNILLQCIRYVINKNFFRKNEFNNQ